MIFMFGFFILKKQYNIFTTFLEEQYPKNKCTFCLDNCLIVQSLHLNVCDCMHSSTCTLVSLGALLTRHFKQRAV